MDYIFDSLADPIEIIITENKKKIPFPDKFRKYPFGIKNRINYTRDMIMMSKITNTKEIYWDDSYDLIEKIEKMLYDYKNLAALPLSRYIIEKKEIPKHILKYYNKLYDIVDIVITKSLINRSDLVLEMIKKLLNICDPSLHIGYRLTIYVSVYFIKMAIKRKNLTRYAETIIQKLKDYKIESNISNFFTQKELDRYIHYVQKILDKQKCKNKQNGL
ncbi:hypothetical protein QJ857_gp0443 [Tupanvirus soda lake]|uniref:Tyrosine-protein phosphatase domain-containing protein n=1 Tax=Tupanvirus deep ocean TaxID=2126984 RepID=A0A2K9L5E6_9VIRU|nr:hypothetical protein QJ857_gp0443 [Tupanvirus soda lake]AUL78424.2 hypothetical protein [Tupanvirus soda lake]